MLCLSFPAFGGHNVPGGYACTCQTPGCAEDYPGECGDHAATQQGTTPNDSAAGLGIVIVALLFWLRMRA